jgi:hypothetical protein
MDAHVGRAQTGRAWALAIGAASIALASAAWGMWVDASTPVPVPTGLCTVLASGQLDVTQIADDAVAALRTACS